jgi:predicted ATP-dependent endonuclease of OLD family
MELVYLWVEDYKNIKKQGFNFSPRFKCHYDETIKKHTIDENKDYVSIFPENINVTAIVGENGSGKSSVLECLNYIFLQDFSFGNYILAYERGGSQYYVSNIEISSTEATKESKFKTSSHIYSNDFTSFTNQISLKKEDILNYILNSSLQKDFQLTTFMYVPNEIVIKSVYLNEKFHKTLKYDYDDYHYSNSINYDDNRKSMYAQEDSINQLLEITDSYHQFLIILFVGESGFDDIFVCENKESLLKQIIESETEHLNESDFNKYLHAIDKKESISSLSKKEKNIYLKYYNFFQFDFIDKENRKYNHLSHGERTIFGQFISIYYLSNKYSKEYLFLFDEAEISLHPQWQKNYLKELNSLLSKLDKQFHFIFTSHSPFLLSDLPKENVIFLDTYKEDATDKNAIEQKKGNCKIVNPDINTFGANIHTLLSHGFFMKDGLMGEFAKGKINEIIKNLNNQNYKPEEKERIKVLRTIQIIGEPFLKQKLLDMYYKKFDKEARKKELEKEKARIEEELKKYD